MSGSKVTIQIDGGPTLTVPWHSGMTAQTALEVAYDQINSAEAFTYGLQYYGSGYGYRVFMINETYDTFLSTFHWEFLRNGEPSERGVDSTVLFAGDTISFRYTKYDPEHPTGSLFLTKEDFATGGMPG